MTKSTLADKGLIWFIGPGHSPLWKEIRAGIQDRKTENEAKATEKYFLLALIRSCFAQFAFINNPEPSAHSEWGPFISIINKKKNVPQTCLQMSLFSGGIFSVEIPSSQMIQAYVKSTKSTRKPWDNLVMSLKTEWLMSRASSQCCWALRWAGSQDKITHS